MIFLCSLIKLLLAFSVNTSFKYSIYILYLPNKSYSTYKNIFHCHSQKNFYFFIGIDEVVYADNLKIEILKKLQAEIITCQIMFLQ